MDSNTYIHIGLPKTGTTTLQAYFEKQKDINYLGKVVPNEKGYRAPEISKIVRNYLTYEKEEQEEDKKKTISYISKEKCNLISDEVISGIGFQNFTDNRYPLITEILARVSLFFSTDKFIIVFREQYSFLKSYYNQLLKYGYCLTFESFICEVINKRYNILDTLKYDDLLSSLEKYKIRVLFFEYLFVDNFINVNYLQSAFIHPVKLSQLSTPIIENPSNNDIKSLFSLLIRNKTNHNQSHLTTEIIENDKLVLRKIMFENDFYYCNNKYIKLLNSIFKTQNQKLEKKLKIKHPDNYV